MNESIVVTVKKMLGLDLDYDVFNSDVIVLINAALMSLTQLGIGPKEGFTVTDYTQTWSDFLVNGILLEAAKMYVFLKVKVTFDPPSSSTVLETYKQQISELEWRLNVQAESIENFDFMTNTKKRGSGDAVSYSGDSGHSSSENETEPYEEDEYEYDEYEYEDPNNPE